MVNNIKGNLIKKKKQESVSILKKCIEKLSNLYIFILERDNQTKLPLFVQKLLIIIYFLQLSGILGDFIYQKEKVTSKDNYLTGLIFHVISYVRINPLIQLLDFDFIYLIVAVIFLLFDIAVIVSCITLSLSTAQLSGQNFKTKQQYFDFLQKYFQYYSWVICIFKLEFTLATLFCGYFSDGDLSEQCKHFDFSLVSKVIWLFYAIISLLFQLFQEIIITIIYNSSEFNSSNYLKTTYSPISKIFKFICYIFLLSEQFSSQIYSDQSNEIVEKSQEEGVIVHFAVHFIFFALLVEYVNTFPYLNIAISNSYLFFLVSFEIFNVIFTIWQFSDQIIDVNSFPIVLLITISLFYGLLQAQYSNITQQLKIYNLNKPERNPIFYNLYLEQLYSIYLKHEKSQKNFIALMGMLTIHQEQCDQLECPCQNGNKIYQDNNQSTEQEMYNQFEIQERKALVQYEIKVKGNYLYNISQNKPLFKKFIFNFIEFHIQRLINILHVQNKDSDELTNTCLKYWFFLLDFKCNYIKPLMESKIGANKMKNTSFSFQIVERSLTTIIENRIKQNDKSLQYSIRLKNIEYSKMYTRFEILVSQDNIIKDLKEQLLDILEQKQEWFEQLVTGHAKIDYFYNQTLRLAKQVNQLDKQLQKLILNSKDNLYFLKLNGILKARLFNDPDYTNKVELEFQQIKRNDAALEKNLINSFSVLNGNSGSIIVSFRTEQQDKGQIIQYSQRWPEMFGYDQNQFRDVKNLNQLMPDLIGSVHDMLLDRLVVTGIPKVIRHFRRALAKRQSGFLMDFKLYLNYFFEISDEFAFSALGLRIVSNQKIILLTEQGDIVGVDENFGKLYHPDIGAQEYNKCNMTIFMPELGSILENYFKDEKNQFDHQYMKIKMEFPPLEYSNEYMQEYIVHRKLNNNQTDWNSLNKNTSEFMINQKPEYCIQGSSRCYETTTSVQLDSITLINGTIVNLFILEIEQMQVIQSINSTSGQSAMSQNDRNMSSQYTQDDNEYVEENKKQQQNSNQEQQQQKKGVHIQSKQKTESIQNNSLESNKNNHNHNENDTNANTISNHNSNENNPLISKQNNNNNNIDNIKNDIKQQENNNNNVTPADLSQSFIVPETQRPPVKQEINNFEMHQTNFNNNMDLVTADLNQQKQNNQNNQNQQAYINNNDEQQSPVKWGSSHQGDHDIQHNQEISQQQLQSKQALIQENNHHEDDQQVRDSVHIEENDLDKYFKEDEEAQDKNHTPDNKTYKTGVSFYNKNLEHNQQEKKEKRKKKNAQQAFDNQTGDDQEFQDDMNDENNLNHNNHNHKNKNSYLEPFFQYQQQKNLHSVNNDSSFVSQMLTISQQNDLPKEIHFLGYSISLHILLFIIIVVLISYQYMQNLSDFQLFVESVPIISQILLPIQKSIIIGQQLGIQNLIFSQNNNISGNFEKEKFEDYLEFLEYQQNTTYQDYHQKLYEYLDLEIMFHGQENLIQSDLDGLQVMVDDQNIKQLDNNFSTIQYLKIVSENIYQAKFKDVQENTTMNDKYNFLMYINLQILQKSFMDRIQDFHNDQQDQNNHIRDYNITSIISSIIVLVFSYGIILLGYNKLKIKIQKICQCISRMSEKEAKMEILILQLIQEHLKNASEDFFQCCFTNYDIPVESNIDKKAQKRNQNNVKKQNNNGNKRSGLNLTDRILNQSMNQTNIIIIHSFLFTIGIIFFVVIYIMVQQYLKNMIPIHDEFLNLIDTTTHFGYVSSMHKIDFIDQYYKKMPNNVENVKILDPVYYDHEDFNKYYDELFEETQEFYTQDYLDLVENSKKDDDHFYLYVKKISKGKLCENEEIVHKKFKNLCKDTNNQLFQRGFQLAIKSIISDIRSQDFQSWTFQDLENYLISEQYFDDSTQYIIAIDTQYSFVQNYNLFLIDLKEQFITAFMLFLSIGSVFYIGVFGLVGFYYLQKHISDYRNLKIALQFIPYLKIRDDQTTHHLLKRIFNF